jgi:hypothetical protein
MSSSSQSSPDPLIDEVRAVRKAISDQFNGDIDHLYEYLRKLESQYKERVRSLSKSDRRRKGKAGEST